MDEDSKDETPPKAPGAEKVPKGDKATPSNEGKGDTNMEEASDANATTEKEGDNEEATAAKATTAKKNDNKRIEALLRQQGQRTSSEPDANMTNSGDDDDSEEEGEDNDGLANCPWTQRMKHAKPA